MEDMGGCLCIGCLDKRLGRTLMPRDFLPRHPFNVLPGTELLVSRRGGRWNPEGRTSNPSTGFKNRPKGSILLAFPLASSSRLARNRFIFNRLADISRPSPGSQPPSTSTNAASSRAACPVKYSLRPRRDIAPGRADHAMPQKLRAKIKRPGYRPASQTLAKCDARDTTGSTILFLGGVGVRYPSSVGRVSRFSGLVFSVSGIVSSPTATQGSDASIWAGRQTKKPVVP
jgi:hypothetical protein